MSGYETIRTFFGKQSVRGSNETLKQRRNQKMKPKGEKGERASCGRNLYIPRFPNCTRAWACRLQIADGTKQKTIWLKIGHPALDAEHDIAGGSLRLTKTRELTTRINSAVKHREASADQIKRTLLSSCPIIEFEERSLKSTFVPVVEEDLIKIPTFDQMFMKWYKLQSAAKRWTHKA